MIGPGLKPDYLMTSKRDVANIWKKIKSNSREAERRLVVTKSLKTQGLKTIKLF